MERLKTITAKTLAETLLCFSIDLIGLMTEYADELRFSHSIVLKRRVLSSAVQTGVILNEQGRALFHCSTNTLEHCDDYHEYPQYKYSPQLGNADIKQIAYHNHSSTLFMFCYSPAAKAVIYHFPSIHSLKACPRIVSEYRGQAVWEYREMGICVDNLFDEQKTTLVYTSNKRELVKHNAQGRCQGTYLYGLDNDVHHLARTKKGGVIVCTEKSVAKLDYFAVGELKYFDIESKLPLCVAVDTRDRVYVLCHNPLIETCKFIMAFEFDQNGLQIYTLQCSKHAVWMQFIYDQLFVFQSNGTRDVYQ